jgi:6-phosphogluconolactonase
VNGRIERVQSVPDAFGRLLLTRIAEAPDDGFSLFLSGGETAQECYAQLAGLGAAVEWGKVDVYIGDERCVPPDHEDSNLRMITETLLDQVPPVRSLHPMYRSGAPESAAADYQREVEQLRRFDLIHLGLGPDGHCASLFPGSTALAIDDPAQLVVANRDPLANNPHDRITLTLPAISRAASVVFTVAGGSKRDALARLLAGEDLPAGRVSAQEVLWLVNAEASEGLDLPE